MLRHLSSIVAVLILTACGTTSGSSAPAAAAEANVEATGSRDLSGLQTRGDSLLLAGNYAQAIQAFERIVEAESHSDLSVYNHLTKAYAHLGLFGRAETYLTRFMLDNRDHPEYIEERLRLEGHCLMSIYATMQGDSDRSLARVDSMLAFEEYVDRYPGPRHCAYRQLTRWGQYHRAAGVLEWLMANAPGANALMYVPYAAHVAREQGDEAMYETLMRQAAQVQEAIAAGEFGPGEETAFRNILPRDVHHWLAQVEMLQGAQESAVASLRRAYEAGDARLYWWREVNPILGQLEGHPAFEDLARDIEQELREMRAQLR